MKSFAINGFGRIGKCVLRAYAEKPTISANCKVINLGYCDPKTHLHLLKYDSTHGIFNGIKIIDDNTINIGHGPIKLISEPDASKINWQDYGVDTVLDCSGRFTKKELALIHINSKAKRVLISAPCDNADATIVYGVNDHILNKSHQVISVGSCTTNCLAPIAKALNDTLGIESGFMTTVHAYTNDQVLLDSSHKDLRRARAAALSMIPSSTGAAKALGLVIPELIGKLDGVAIRVPTPNVSMVDLTFVSSKATTVEEINKTMKAAVSKMKGALAYTEEELVSVDFNHNPASSIFDATQTRVVNNTFCRIATWYDNEWGFSNRMLDVLDVT